MRKTGKHTATTAAAWLAFMLGWTLTIIAFFIAPMGDIPANVLWLLGQSLTFFSSVYGLRLYIDNRLAPPSGSQTPTEL